MIWSWVIVWDEARPQLVNKAFLMHEGHGTGQSYRLCRGSQLPRVCRSNPTTFINAVLLGAKGDSHGVSGPAAMSQQDLNGSKILHMQVR